MNDKERAEQDKSVLFLSQVTGIVPQTIFRYLKSNGRVAYKEVKIPKGDTGKFRTLHIPNEELKFLQKAVLERLLYRLPVSTVSHCAVPGRSVVTNTAPHLNSRAFFRIDFEDAFPSVTKHKLIRHLTPLIRDNINEYDNPSSLVAVIAELTTHKNALPQGAPTSPYLLNLVCFALDQALIGLAKDFNLHYTRYADDLWFSTHQSRIHPEVRRTIIEIVQEGDGFKINREKVRYKTGKATVPRITGLTLIFDSKNDETKMSVCRKAIEEYRTEIHKATYNSETDVSKLIGKVFGIIGWVTMATGGRIPNRLKKPFAKFLAKRCPEKIPSYRHLV